MTRQHWLIAAACMVLIPLSILWFLTNFERKDIEVASNWQGEARTNPLYAARLFLKRMGIPTYRIEHPLSLDKLPPISTTILLATERTTLSGQRIQNLLAWVAKGGHLITAATQYGLETDPEYNDEIDDLSTIPLSEGRIVQDHLQDQLGIYSDELLSYYDTTAIETTPDTETFSQELNTQDNEIIATDSENIDVDSSITYKDTPHWYFTLENDKTFFIRLAHFYPLINAYAHEDQQIFSDNGAVFGQHHRYEKGYVTLLGSLDIFDNYDIDEADNAEFFWHIIHYQDRTPESVWLLHNNEMPFLLAWLWQKAPLFLISLSLLLVATLIAAGQRFGPLIPVPERNRRSLIEHIRASAYFFWQHRQHTFLLNSTRQAVHQHIMHLHPGWRHLNQAEQYHWLIEQTQLPKEYIYALLHDSTITHAQDFRRLVQQLQTLKNTL